MSKPTLDKEQNKRFDEWWIEPSAEVGEVRRDDVKDLLADELAREREKIIVEFERTRDLVQGDSIFLRWLKRK